MDPPPPPPPTSSSSANVRHSPPLQPSWATKNAFGLHGNTSPGRLRLIDTALSLLQIYPFFHHQQPPLAQELHQDSDDGKVVVDVVVDVGIGDDPSTTFELAKAVHVTSQQQQQHLLVIGTEVDVDRLRRAESVLQHARRTSPDNADGTCIIHDNAALERISLRLGTTDFSLPLNNANNPHCLAVERPIVVRAMNVLRDYSVPDAIAALHKLHEQLEPAGGFLVEGSAETQGRVAMALVMPKVLLHDGDSDSDSSVEEEIPISAVIFVADLTALTIDPDYNNSCPSDVSQSPAKWFNRHNHLPRLYRGFCDASECPRHETPAWVVPMRSFLELWEEADAGDDDSTCSEDSSLTVTERFVRSAMLLKDKAQDDLIGTVVTDWASQGIVVWHPGEKELVVPGVDEWFYYRQRITH